MNKLTIALAVGLAGTASAANLRAEQKLAVTDRAFLAYAKEKYDCTVAGNDLEGTAKDILAKATAAEAGHVEKCAAADTAFDAEETRLKGVLDTATARTNKQKAEEFRTGNNADHVAADAKDTEKMEGRKSAAQSKVDTAKNTETTAIATFDSATKTNGERQSEAAAATTAHNNAVTKLATDVPESKAEMEADLAEFARDMKVEIDGANSLATDEIAKSAQARTERKQFCTTTKDTRQAVIDADNAALGKIKPLLAKLAANGCKDASDLTAGASVAALLETGAASHLTAEVQAKCDAITAQILMNGPSTFLQMAQKSAADPTHAFSASFDEWGKAVSNDQADADRVKKECDDEADRVYADEVDNKGTGNNPLVDHGASASPRYTGAHNLVKDATIADSQAKEKGLREAEEKRHADLEKKLQDEEADAKLGKETAINKAEAAAQALTDATTAKDGAITARQEAEAHQVSENTKADAELVKDKAANLLMFETTPANSQQAEDQDAYDSDSKLNKNKQTAKAAFCAATKKEYEEEIATVNSILSEMSNMSSGSKMQTA